MEKVGEESPVRFCQVKYAPSGAISTLLTKKADAGLLIPRRANLLIRAAKSVDSVVVGIKVLENWQRLNVYKMPLERYLGEGKMVLLKKEAWLAPGMRLKTLPQWLISKTDYESSEKSITNGVPQFYHCKR